MCGLLTSDSPNISKTICSHMYPVFIAFSNYKPGHASTHFIIHKIVIVAYNSMYNALFKLTVSIVLRESHGVIYMMFTYNMEVRKFRTHVIIRT